MAITSWAFQKITVTAPGDEEPPYGEEGIDGAPNPLTHEGSMYVTKRLIAVGNNQVWYEDI